MWLPLMRPLLGTWPETQVCVLAGSQTRDPLVHRPVPNPLSYTSQGPALGFPIELGEEHHRLKVL